MSGASHDAEFLFKREKIIFQKKFLGKGDKYEFRLQVARNIAVPQSLVAARKNLLRLQSNRSRNCSVRAKIRGYTKAIKGAITKDVSIPVIMANGTKVSLK